MTKKGIDIKFSLAIVLVIVILFAIAFLNIKSYDIGSAINNAGSKLVYNGPIGKVVADTSQDSCSDDCGGCLDNTNCINNGACCCLPGEECVQTGSSNPPSYACQKCNNPCGNACCSLDQVCNLADNTCKPSNQCNTVVCRGKCCIRSKFAIYSGTTSGDCVCCNYIPGYNPYDDSCKTTDLSSCAGGSGVCSCNPNTCDYPSCYSCF